MYVMESSRSTASVAGCSSRVSWHLLMYAVEREASFISLYFGEDVSEEDAQQAAGVFESACPEAEVAILSGGQPVYYYIISME